MSQKFCNILVTYLLYSSNYNKSSLEFKVEDIVLQSEATFLPVLWFHAISFCRSRLLLTLTSFGCWSVLSTGSELWIKPSCYLLKLGLDYILVEATFLQVLFLTDTSSCSLKQRTPSLKLLLFLGCWSIVSTWAMNQNK